MRQYQIILGIATQLLTFDGMFIDMWVKCEPLRARASVLGGAIICHLQ